MSLGGERLSKAHPIMESVGDVDELRAHTAVLRLMISALRPKDDALAAFLLWLMHTYFLIGTACSDPLVKKEQFHKRKLKESDLARLEKEQARLEAKVELPRQFIVSASNALAAQADVTVTVVRRLERSIAAVRKAYPEFEAGVILAFVNRLSDYFYVLARYLEEGNHIALDYEVLDREE